MVRPDEISDVIRKKIEDYSIELKEVDYGNIIQVGDNIAVVYGLNDAKAGELLEFPNNIYGLVMNLKRIPSGADRKSVV